MIIKFHWVKGHADLLDRTLSIDERLNMVVDLQADETRFRARVSTAARPACTHFNIEVASISLLGGNLNSH
jgi:hypothetical protein